jgi:hypothetical protein
LTTDRDGLIFTARKGSKSGGYIVPLDKKVLAAIAAASEGANGEPSESAPKSDVEVVPKRLRSESALTPREMQARLRAGRTIDEVAAEAGVDTEWVARFAVPILAEQAQVVELARGLVYAKPRLGESTEPLGASVVQNLSDKGVFLPDDVASAGWSAFQLHDSVWMVRFRYRSRGRDQEAHWEIDVPTGRLRARNRVASDLGYVGPDRWRTDDDSELAADDEAPPPPAKPARRRAVPAPARRPAAKAPAAAGRRSPAAKKVTGRPATPAPAARSTPSAPARRKAATPAAPARSTPAAPARSTAARNVKAAPAAKKAVTRKPATKSTARPAPAKTASRRRATKAVPAPEAGPTAGSGGVRMAVARVSTARVAASMAKAEREPWAAAVRRPTTRAGAGGTGGATLARPTVKQAASRDRGVEVKESERFQPRPLPPPGSEPLPPRVRKVTLPRPRIVGGENGSPPTEILPAVDRPKRRRLRSR